MDTQLNTVSKWIAEKTKEVSCSERKRKVSICYRKWACKTFLYFFPRLWLWHWVSFKMWPFHTHKEHIKHTLCSRKVLTEVRFMCWSLDFQIETNSDTKMHLIYNLLVVITSAGRSVKTVYLSKKLITQSNNTSKSLKTLKSTQSIKRVTVNVSTAYCCMFKFVSIL